jgi:hypothetical protein
MAHRGCLLQRRRAELVARVRIGPGAQQRRDQRRVARVRGAHGPQISANVPVLSPTFSTGTPARSSSVSSRFACGVSCGYTQVLAALDAAVTLAEHDVRQRVVVVQVAVRHVAAVQDDRVVEQRAVAVLRVGQLLDELREDLRVVVLDADSARSSPGRSRGATAGGRPR